MQTLKKLGANAMAAFLDIGAGAMIALTVTSLVDTTLTPSLLMVGIIAALLPDTDIVPFILLRKPITFDHHQTLWHRPLLLIPVSVAMSFVTLGTVGATIVGCALIWHYLHDTDWIYPPTRGIAWLWPFSTKFISWYGTYQQPQRINHDDHLERRWIAPSLTSVSEVLLGLILFSTTIYLSDLGPALFTVSGIMVLVSLGTWIVSRPS
jgi:hypothetical protein